MRTCVRVQRSDPRGPPARADRARDRVARRADQRRPTPAGSSSSPSSTAARAGAAPAAARPPSGWPGAARSPPARPASTSASRGRCRAAADPRGVRPGRAQLLEGAGADPGRRRESEADLLELARHATAAQLERMVRAARRVTTGRGRRGTSARATCAGTGTTTTAACTSTRSCRPRTARSSCARSRRRATRSRSFARRSATTVPRNRARLPRNRLAERRFRGTAAALRAAAAADERRVARRRCARRRSPGRRPGLTGGERYQLLLHVDASTLATDSPGASVPGPGSCAIADGPGIAPETARRLACDSLDRRDRRARRQATVGVGRRTRSIPPSVRRALVARDGRCQFPGCERHRFVDAHHIVHWAQGGATDARQPRACSAATTTGSSTRAATRCLAHSLRVACASRGPTASRSSPLPRCARDPPPAAACRAARCSPARARRWTSLVYRGRPRRDRGDLRPTAPAARGAGAPG